MKGKRQPWSYYPEMIALDKQLEAEQRRNELKREIEFLEMRKSRLKTELKPGGSKMKPFKQDNWVDFDKLEELFQEYYNESDLDDDRWIDEEEFVKEVVAYAAKEAQEFLESKKCGCDDDMGFDLEGLTDNPETI